MQHAFKLEFTFSPGLYIMELIFCKGVVFMLDIGLLTLENVASLLIYMAIGYILRRSGKLPSQTSAVLSTLTTTIFLPAYTIQNLSQSFTVDKLGANLSLFGLGSLFILLAIVVGLILAKLLGRTDFEKKTYRYAFTFPNYGYFGYPVIEGVFGSSMLAKMLIFCIPVSIATSTYGYFLFSKEKRITLKQILTTPTVIAIIVGCGLGLSGLQLPKLLSKFLSGTGSCMSPTSMLLGGFVLGKFPLRKLLSGVRGYWLSAIRLLGIPLLFGIILMLCGASGTYLMLPVLVFALPLGMNMVVFPESYGIDASDNARTCFVSYLLAVVILPLTFSLIFHLAGF